MRTILQQFRKIPNFVKYHKIPKLQQVNNQFRSQAWSAQLEDDEDEDEEGEDLVDVAKEGLDVLIKNVGAEHVRTSIMITYLIVVRITIKSLPFEREPGFGLFRCFRFGALVIHQAMPLVIRSKTSKLIQFL